MIDDINARMPVLEYVSKRMNRARMRLDNNLRQQYLVGHAGQRTLDDIQRDFLYASRRCDEMVVEVCFISSDNWQSYLREVLTTLRTVEQNISTMVKVAKVES